MLARILPGAKWVHHAHGAPGRLFGVPVGYVATVWNQRGPADPAVRRWYGWRHPPIFAQFDRPFPYNWPLSYYRCLAEWNIAGNQNGFGRKGADFWPVLEGRRMYPVSERLSSGRYPLSDRGNRNIYLPDWLAPGPDGAVSTVRYVARLWYPAGGWQERSAALYRAAAEVERALARPGKGT